MRLTTRVLRAFAALLVILPVPGAARQDSAQVAPAASTLPAPKYLQPDDPWIYRGTDIPVDKDWMFGEMPNGVRYAVRRNGVPPGQVSMRIRIDAGSLHENNSEQGFAHLIEHLVFRESKYLGNAEAIPHFQRLGASLGNDTNAITSPTQTVYQLDLPNAQGQVLDDSIRLFAGMIREPRLSAANLSAEVPIVLAERRERNGPERRIAEATREVLFAGQRLAERSPIGTVQTLQAATPEAVQAFHKRWYRPDKAVVVLVGDADPMRLASLVEENFADWTANGAATPDPDFGDPRPPAGADPVNPVGETRVVVEPGQPRALTYAVMRPWHQVTDNLEYNRGLLIDAIAQSIVNRRLETAARAGGSYLYASVDTEKTSRSSDGTYITLAPLTSDWKGALSDVRSVIADAVAEPPSQAEIDRELSEFDVVFANMVEQERIQAGSKLADDIVNAEDIREAVATPQTILDVFRGMRDRFTPQAVHEHTVDMFKGVVVRGIYLTPEAGEADSAAIHTALLAQVDGNGANRSSADALSFADLPPIGTPTEPIVRQPLGIFDSAYLDDVEALVYPNGVRVLLWPTANEPGRATVRVRFGSGLMAFRPEEGAYVQLGQLALIGSGQGPLGQNELDLLAAGRKFGFDFRIEDGTFILEGLTRAEDVADQLYLFASKLAMPRWDAAPVERAKASMLLSYDSYGGNPNGVINRDLNGLLHDGDPRYRTPNAAELQKTTPEGFKQVWSRMLAQGPVEVDVFGDFNREAVVQTLSKTFGALPERRPASAAELTAPGAFPAANNKPLVLTHRGEDDQAAAVIAWPTGGGSAGLPESRKLEVLAQVFSNRLMDEMRERAGASYSPYVGSTWPLDAPSGGNIIALAQLPPEQVTSFFAAADEIARDLAANGPTQDELGRVTEPMLQLLNRMQTGHTFWLNQVSGGAFDANRRNLISSMMSDYTAVSPAELRELAAKYFGAHGGYRVAVMPGEGSTAAGR